MSYDPDPRRRRRGRVPPQLRAWVYGRRRRTPRRRARVYRRVPRARRYDPDPAGPRRRFGRIRRLGTGIEGFLHRHAGKIGGLLALAGGIHQGYENMKRFAPANPWGRYLNILKDEWKMLVSFKGDWNPLNYLIYKFTGYNPYGDWELSAWVAPFWLSTAAYLATKYKLLPISPRINAPLNRLAHGAMLTSVFGALFLPGTRPTDSSTATSTTARTTTQTELNYYR